MSNGVQFALVFSDSPFAALLSSLAERSGMHQLWCVGSGDCVCQQERKRGGMLIVRSALLFSETSSSVAFGATSCCNSKS